MTMNLGSDWNCFAIKYSTSLTPSLNNDTWNQSK